MQRNLIILFLVALVFLTGCEFKNNSITDKDDNINMNPTVTPGTKYQKTICKQDRKHNGVDDKTVYIINHSGDDIKSIKMTMHYKLNEDSGKDFFDESKSVLTNITDKLKDVVGLTTNVIEDSSEFIKAEVNLELDKMNNNDMMKFDYFKVSKSLSLQKKNFLEKGIKCN